MNALIALASLVLVLLSAPAAVAQVGEEGDVIVDIELVLAVDVSRSMTPRELEIQRRGYAEALVSPEVIDAITSGFHGQVALTYVEWAGVGSQRVVVDWTLIRGSAEAAAFAAQLTSYFDSSMRRTSISGAIDFAAGLFDGNGFAAHRRVIDVSGDGPNNQGRTVTTARDEALARGLAINGLPLMTREGMGSQWHIEDLDRYYYHCVIGGPGAFVIPVLQWSDFPQAVRRKLVLELSEAPAPWPAPPRTPIAHANWPGNGLADAAGAEEYDCLVGERIWDSMWGGVNGMP